MLIVSYTPLLVAGAVLVALMAAFTGMHLTHGLSQMSVDARKPQIVRAAVVLGGGVWSTHFVAMLALDLPVTVFYDPLFTLGSALIAILMAGASLLLMHFGPRGPVTLALAGTLLGLGVVVMHYVGMLGMRGCNPVFAPAGYGLATVLAVGMGIGALRLSYGRRTRMGLSLGAVLFAAAILAVHFTAMAWTGFVALDTIVPRAGLVAHDMLALFVVLAVFLICGAFLLTTATLGAPAETMIATGPEPEKAPAVAAPPVLQRIPYEQDGRTYFTAPEDIVAIRAEGHYTTLQRTTDRVFCPLAIAKLDAGLASRSFMRTHRSHIVNLRHVRGFERRKDQGLCLFDPQLKVDPVPVSRTRVGPIMKALGL